MDEIDIVVQLLQDNRELKLKIEQLKQEKKQLEQLVQEHKKEDTDAILSDADFFRF
ncbi:hypothetical protein ONV75_11550 [Clostridium sp. LQ25]|uniref:hypothetical protein n=1 Tax=Clostridium TaxID=1485 RepID=UPI000ACBC65E|nr:MULTISPECIES: hypothetical protein [Clostridium]UZT05218.1 hypothetical protein ONV75_11550 [Clostridium sp. LQ25]